MFESNKFRLMAFYQWWADYLLLMSAIGNIGEEPKENGYFDQSLALMLSYVYEGCSRDMVADITQWFLDDLHWVTAEPEIMAYWHEHYEEVYSYEEAAAAVKEIAKQKHMLN